MRNKQRIGVMAEWTPPSEFDGFVVQRRIGQGGMGRVYLAHEIDLDRPVALKFIAEAAPGSAARERFLVEARAIARIQHPNIVAIYRLGQVEGRPYIAYEYVDGKTLDRLPRPLGWTRALEIGVAVARGLGAIHRLGILHRDIKPANVILATDGALKLVDFGVAKLPFTSQSQPPSGPRSSEGTRDEIGTPPPAASKTEATSFALADTAAIDSSKIHVAQSPLLDDHPPTQTGVMLGTPSYLPPEIWVGCRASTRSDVYAAGLLLYELCAGSLPYAGLSGHELMQYVMDNPLPPLASVRPTIPGSFGRVVDRAVMHDPTERFFDGTEMLASLEAVEGVLRGFKMVAPRGILHDDAAIVSASLTRLENRADQLIESIYIRLFSAHPELRRLFPMSLAEQQHKLASALRLAVDNLENPSALAPLLEDLGRRHRGHGVVPEHFTMLGEAIIGGLREFDAANWSSETEQAWRRAYASIAEAMIRGMAPEAMAVNA